MNQIVDRRSVVTATAAMPAIALSLPATAAAETSQEAPCQRVSRLMKELAIELDGYDEGRWFARVYPAGNERGNFLGNISQHPESPRHIGYRMSGTIEVHRDARRELDIAADLMDGTEPCEAVERRWQKAGRAERKALLKLCSQPAMNGAERSAKAVYLARYVKDLGEPHIHALLGSLR